MPAPVVSTLVVMKSMAAPGWSHWLPTGPLTA